MNETSRRRARPVSDNHQGEICQEYTKQVTEASEQTARTAGAPTPTKGG